MRRLRTPRATRAWRRALTAAGAVVAVVCVLTAAEGWSQDRPVASPSPSPSPRATPAPDSDAHDPQTDPIARSVVKIYTTYRQPDFYQPWQMGAEGNLSGSGTIIEGHRILTNAHVVANSVFVQVRKSGDPARYAAEVEFIGNDTELAVLRVREPRFFEDAPPLPLGELPRRRDKVEVYGYPEGGDELSVTEGVVSRVEVTEYTHSGRSLLTFQTDAAINPGNSGGPIVKDAKVVGVSFQTMTEAQNVAYAVPAPLIARFLDDIRDGTYHGIPDLGLRWDSVENGAKRAFLRMKAGVGGIRVSAVVFDSSSGGRLQPDDILLAVEDARLADDGTVALRRGERVLFTHLVSRMQVGQEARLSVLRNGQEITVTLPLKPSNVLVPGPFYGIRPSFFVYAGLVFTPLTRNYIETWDDYKDVPTELKHLFEEGLPTAERRQVILVSHVLADPVNEGYHEYGNLVVRSINGRRIGSLPDVIEAVRHPKDGFHVIEAESRQLIVLDADEAKQASPQILARYGLPADRSPDLRAARR
jgi:S1-C subfamily serine protease